MVLQWVTLVFQFRSYLGFFGLFRFGVVPDACIHAATCCNLQKLYAVSFICSTSPVNLRVSLVFCHKPSEEVFPLSYRGFQGFAALNHLKRYSLQYTEVQMSRKLLVPVLQVKTALAVTLTLICSNLAMNLAFLHLLWFLGLIHIFAIFVHLSIS